LPDNKFIGRHMLEAVAQRSVVMMADLLSGRLSGVPERAGNELYAVVSRRLRHSDRSAVEAFEGAPDSLACREALVATVLSQLARDHEFRERVQGLVGQPAPTVTVHATGRSAAAGRDVNQNRKTSYGGLVVGGVALVVIIALILVGRVVVNVLEGLPGQGLSGDSTCRDYLASTDVGEKQRVMKALYLERDKPSLAGDPFIIQNTEYYCGNRPDDTLADVATNRG
jgi:hypothetical protein